MIHLHTQRLPATHNADLAPSIVLLHGWGMSSAVWSPWLTLLRRQANLVLVDLPGYGASEAYASEDVSPILEAILQAAPPRAIYLGYSLGGMLAMAIASSFPQRVSALITLASNAKFVADAGWSHGMPEETFQQFFDSVTRPALAMKRFAGLQVHGCDQEKRLLKWLRSGQEVLSSEVLQVSLQWLHNLDLRAAINDIQVPSLFCFAQRDALVPVAVVDQFPAACSVIVPAAAHALFLSHPAECAELIQQFLQSRSLGGDSKANSAAGSFRNKRDVARSFSRAAKTYDTVAALQREVGGRLLELSGEHCAGEQQRVVDLGCGTGHFFSGLRRRFMPGQLLGIDIAEGMVQLASQRYPQGEWLCGDAENLPLANDSVALIYSSLTIQWCENTSALFSEIFRVLQPGGIFMFSTLGPNTLHELKTAWEQVDNCVHVNQFQDWNTLELSAKQAGMMSMKAPEERMLVMEYASLRELTRELKSLGAHNVNQGRPAGLTGKQRVKRFMQAYEQCRNERGLLPATYQVWYGIAEKPQDPV